LCLFEPQPLRRVSGSWEDVLRGNVARRSYLIPIMYVIAEVVVLLYVSVPTGLWLGNISVGCKESALYNLGTRVTVNKQSNQWVIPGFRVRRTYLVEMLNDCGEQENYTCIAYNGYVHSVYRNYIKSLACSSARPSIVMDDKRGLLIYILQMGNTWIFENSAIDMRFKLPPVLTAVGLLLCLWTVATLVSYKCDPRSIILSHCLDGRIGICTVAICSILILCIGIFM